MAGAAWKVPSTNHFSASANRWRLSTVQKITILSVVPSSMRTKSSPFKVLHHSPERSRSARFCGRGGRRALLDRYRLVLRLLKVGI